jgi:hypothetical protein
MAVRPSETPHSSRRPVKMAKHNTPHRIFGNCYVSNSNLIPFSSPSVLRTPAAHKTADGDAALKMTPFTTPRRPFGIICNGRMDVTPLKSGHAFSTVTKKLDLFEDSDDSNDDLLNCSIETMHAEQSSMKTLPPTFFDLDGNEVCVKVSQHLPLTLESPLPRTVLSSPSDCSLELPEMLDMTIIEVD